MTLTVVPVTLPVANAYVQAFHRHHPPIPGGFAWWAVAAVDEFGEFHGVAIAGRPTNRNNDDGQTVEVLRVATDGTKNAPSLLLGACGKAAKALGAALIITYTLDDESGASLRAVGWDRAKSGIRSWWTSPTAGRSPGRERAHTGKTKTRWERRIRDPVPVVQPLLPVNDDIQATLFEEF